MNETKRPICPQCGEELDPDDILVPVYDKTGENLIDCFHMNKNAFRKMEELMNETGMSFEDLIKLIIEKLDEGLSK